jgi:hypothetical protein
MKLQIKLLAIIFTLAFLSTMAFGYKLDNDNTTFDLSGATLFQLAYGSATQNEMDAAFVRGELKFNVTSKKNNIMSLLHLRFQGDIDKTGANDAKIRQAYLKIPISTASITAGRYYQFYSPGAYFGRFLNSPNDNGTGSALTSYAQHTGLKLTVPFSENKKTALELEALPVIKNFQVIRYNALFLLEPSDLLKFTLGGSIQTDPTSSSNNFSFSAKVSPSKVFNIYTEYAVVKINKSSQIKNNSWVVLGFNLPSGGFLDKLCIEAEYKISTRSGSTDNLACMLLMQKKIGTTKIDLGIGSDPKGLKATEFKELGGFLRVTASFK